MRWQNFTQVMSGRAMLAPTIRAFFFDAAVGAAIGRPPVNIRSYVKQNASSVKISTMSPVGHGKKDSFKRCTELPLRQQRTSNARPYKTVVYCNLSFRQWRYTEQRQSILSGYRNTDTHDLKANRFPAAAGERSPRVRTRRRYPAGGRSHRRAPACRNRTST